MQDTWVYRRTQNAQYIAFPVQQWLFERALLLHYKYKHRNIIVV